MGRPREGKYHSGSKSLEVTYNGPVTVLRVDGQEFAFNEVGLLITAKDSPAGTPAKEVDDERREPRIKVPNPPRWNRG